MPTALPFRGQGPGRGVLPRRPADQGDRRPDRGPRGALLPFVVLLAAVLGVSDSHARDDNPFHLPEGALARLGGRLSGGDRTVVYSPDGTLLAVATEVGIWLYEARTGTEVALLKGHTFSVKWVSFMTEGYGCGGNYIHNSAGFFKYYQSANLKKFWNNIIEKLQRKRTSPVPLFLAGGWRMSAIRSGILFGSP